MGRWDLAALTINGTIAAGILGLPGRVYALVGPYSVLACLAGGVLMGLVAACYAECASRYQGTGGSILYAQAAFGHAAGFAAGWLAVVTRLLAYASIGNLAVGYAAALLPWLDRPAGRVISLTVLTWGLGGVIATGVGLSARANAAFTLAKLALLGGFVAVGVVALRPLHLPALPAAPPAAHWAPSIVLLLFGLAGMESTVVNGGEMRDPRRDVPFGLGMGLLAVVALYAAILLVCAGLVPQLATSQRPFFDGMVAALGTAAGRVVAAGAVVIMAGTLFAILFTGPRLVFALAQGGHLPARLARIHPRSGTPLPAVLLHTALAWALAVASSFLGALTASTLTRLMLYALTAASLVAMRRRGLSEQPAPLLLPGGLWGGVGATMLCVWLMSQVDRAAWVATLWCLVVGLGVFLVGQRKASGPFL